MSVFIDGDLAANNGGWQWTASTGCDPSPYFRYVGLAFFELKFAVSVLTLDPVCLEQDFQPCEQLFSKRERRAWTDHITRPPQPDLPISQG